MTVPVSVYTVEQLGQLPPLQNLHGTPLIARGLNVIFGPSGSYKSFYALDLALTVAQKAPVVYVAAEGSSGLFKRVGAWCNYYTRTAGQLHFICEEINLREPPSVRAFLELVIPLKPALVIFDTLARCLVGGEENSAKDMGMAIHHCALTQRALKSAVGIVHHSNRAEKGERGSGAIRGAADAMIEIAPTGDGAVKISCSKIKDAEPWESGEFVFHPIDDSGVLLPADDSRVAASRLTATELQILEFLNLEVFDPGGATAKQIMEALNVHDRHVYRLLSHLKRNCHLTHDSKGDPYRISVSGKRVICKKTATKAKVINLFPSLPSNPSDTTDI